MPKKPLPWELDPLPDEEEEEPLEEVLFEICPNCGDYAVEKQCKIVCPTCHTLISNCNGD